MYVLRNGWGWKAQYATRLHVRRLGIIMKMQVNCKGPGNPTGAPAFSSPPHLAQCR